MWEDDWKIVEGFKPPDSGQGEVSKVRSRHDGRFGALKVLRREFLHIKERRFRMYVEASALTLLNGAGVPLILASNKDDWENKDKQLYIVMEWVEGDTLAKTLDGDPLDIDAALAVTQGILSTIGRCHDLDIHHRDLKPDNVILRGNSFSSPVLVDFGTSWSKPEEGVTKVFQTPAGSELGNRFLRLPEFSPGSMSHDSRSDISMVTGLLFFMLAGVGPRVLVNAEERMPHEAHASKFPATTVGDPRWSRLRRVFQVGFQPTLSRRFQTVDQLRTALENLDPPDKNNEQANLTEATQRLADLMESAEVRAVEKDKATMLGAMKKFEAELRKGLRGAGRGDELGCAGQGSPFPIENNTGLSDRFVITQHNDPNPAQATCRHIMRVRDGMVSASMGIEDGPIENYYSGPIADEESLGEASERMATPVLTRLLDIILPRIAAKYSA